MSAKGSFQIGHETVSKFRQLLSLMHSISETFLDLCGLKKNIRNLFTAREKSMLYGYSEKYGTGLEQAALYFRCVLD
jgi:hypothetical protein